MIFPRNAILTCVATALVAVLALPIPKAISAEAKAPPVPAKSGDDAKSSSSPSTAGKTANPTGTTPTPAASERQGRRSAACR